jgi:hypothetical protein
MSQAPNQDSEEQWTEWALALFGGNIARAEAAARAAMHAEAMGLPSEAVVTAARDAYLSDSSALTPNGGPAITIHPSGSRVLGLPLIAAATLGIIACFIRFGSDGLALSAVITALIGLGVWVLAMRAKVTLSGNALIVRSWIRQRELQASAINEIAMSSWNPWWALPGVLGASRMGWVAAFTGIDASALLEIHEGAWTRGDIQRIASELGVRCPPGQSPTQL